MTTLAELRDTVNVLEQLWMNLEGEVRNGRDLVARVKQMINDPNFSATINVDQFIAIQTPIYLDLLTKVEAAADNLGSDALH